MKASKIFFILFLLMLLPTTGFAFERIDWENGLTLEQQKMLSPYKPVWEKITLKKQQDLLYKTNLLLDLKLYASQSEDVFQEKWDNLSKADQNFVKKLMKDNKRRRVNRAVGMRQGELHPYPRAPAFRMPENAQPAKN